MTPTRTSRGADSAVPTERSRRAACGVVIAADYSAPVSADPRPAGDLPDFQLPEKGKPVGAISVRVTDEADLVGLLVALRDAGADIVAINTFPATRGEPDVTRVFDFEIRSMPAAAAAR